MNIFGALKTLGDFKRLSDILSHTEVGADLRWKALQQWLADNPEYQSKLYHCLSLTPAEALPYLCRELGLDFDGLRTLDPTSQIPAMATNAIEQFQQLYKERAGANAAGLLTAPTKQKRK